MIKNGLTSSITFYGNLCDYFVELILSIFKSVVSIVEAE